MFPEAEPRETLRFVSDLLYSQRRHQKTQCENGGRRSTFAGISALLRSDVIDFAMLPTQRFLRETVSLLDVM